LVPIMDSTRLRLTSQLAFSCPSVTMTKTTFARRSELQGRVQRRPAPP
jgi:hypothetical protein